MNPLPRSTKKSGAYRCRNAETFRQVGEHNHGDLVTHDPRILNWADQIIKLEDGRVVSDESN